MARPTTLKGSQLLIELGDGATPTEAFEAPCALNTKGINFTATTNETSIGDCDAPDDPLWVERVINTLSATISGSGILAFESYETWREWFLSGLERNVRVTLATPAPNGGHYLTRAVLTGFDTTGNQGELVNISVEMQSSGEVTWVPAV